MEDGVEVTAKMCKAGVRAWRECGSEEPAEVLAVQVYKAMEQARREETTARNLSHNPWRWDRGMARYITRAELKDAIINGIPREWHTWEPEIDSRHFGWGGERIR